MQILRLFPTAVGISNDIEMCHKIYPVAKTFLDDEKYLTYTWNYKNTYGSGEKLDDKEELKFISEYFLDKGSQFLIQCGFADVELRAELFFSEMYDGDKHIRHVHPNCVLSGVMYLKVPEKSSSIAFYDPAPQKEYANPPSITMNEFTSPAFEVEPQEGMMLIFPSWLPHEVYINKSETARTTVVFNLIRK